MGRKLPLLAACVVGGLLILERRFPLERSPHGRQRRRTNAALGLIAAAATGAVEMPLTRIMARWVERYRWGIAGLESKALRTLLSLLWLDYSLYLWHRAAHEWRPLWRLHLPHHLDPTLDTTSSWRFHALELLGSVPPRMLQVLIAGVPRDALQTWRELLLMSIAFHHSNLRLPAWLEGPLGLVIMTPRLHRIHHSARRDQRSSNWSSGLSVWDHLHATYRRAQAGTLDVPIGVDGEAHTTALTETLLLPWTRELAPP